MRHIHQHFTSAVRINRLCPHALAAIVHVRGVGERHHIFGKRIADSPLVIRIIRGNVEEVVVSLKFCCLMAYWFLRKYQANAGSILHTFLRPIAVMNIKSQI